MSLAHELLALGNAELVLFVDDDQPEPFQFKARLNQRMCADKKRRRLRTCETLDFGLWTLDFPNLVGTRLQKHGQAERLEPALKSLEMLFGQNLRRCHERDVETAFKGHQRA